MKTAWLLPLALLGACGGQSGTITLQVVTSPTDDPFMGAAQARITVGMNVQTVAVDASGHFNINFGETPMSMSFQPVLVEALDSAGNTIAYGTTPPLQLSPSDQGPISVWVGRPGKAASAAAALMTPRTEVSAVGIQGLGVLFAGGRGTDGKALASTEVYDVFTQAVIQTTPMTSPRASAAGVSTAGVRAVEFGGATADGFGAAGNPLNTAELFDPTVGLGLWSPLTLGPVDARSQAGTTLLPSGSALIAGGADANGNPLGTALLLTTDASPMVSALPSPMVAPRLGAAVAQARFTDGDGAILFGGLAKGSTAPVAERLVGQAFSAYDVGTEANRTGATATTLSDGRVLILGGHDDAGNPLASGLVITPGPPPQVMDLPMALSVARDGHTATLLGNNDVLVCGGAAAAGMLDASCDLIDPATLMVKETIPLSAGRRDLTATLLETGTVVLAGGIDQSGAPSPLIEIYTPER